jgi:hypothetical protein
VNTIVCGPVLRTKLPDGRDVLAYRMPGGAIRAEHFENRSAALRAAAKHGGTVGTYRGYPGFYVVLEPVETYRKLAPGDAGYDLVKANQDLGSWVCDAYDHNEPGGCPNPGCFKHPKKEDQ